MQRIIKGLCGRLERLSINHVNWLKTIYFNFRTLPWREARHLPFYIYGSPAFNNLSGKIDIQCPIKRGMFKINVQHEFAPGLQTLDSQLVLCGRLILRGCVHIGCGTKIIITGDAVLDLGANVVITDFCNVDCCKHIEIGDGTRIAHRSQLMDSNHHYVFNTKKMTVANNMRPISIGRSCWICNTVTLTAGAKVPDFCIVGSNSLVNKDFSSEGRDTLIAGSPAKVIAHGVFRVFDAPTEGMLIDHFAKGASEYVVPEGTDVESFRRMPPTL